VSWSRILHAIIAHDYDATIEVNRSALNQEVTFVFNR